MEIMGSIAWHSPRLTRQDLSLAQEPLVDETKKELACVVTNWRKEQRRHLANESSDQWRWKTRKQIVPLLHISAVDELIVSEIVQPCHAGYVHPFCVEIYCSGSLEMGPLTWISSLLYQGLKAARNARHRLLFCSSREVTRSQLAEWCELSNENAFRFACVKLLGST